MDYKRLARLARVREPTHSTSPHQTQLDRIYAQLARTQTQVSKKYRLILDEWFKGLSTGEITKEHGIAHNTIKRALNDPKSLKYLSLLQQQEELRGGPTQEERKALLWRVALKQETSNPQHSIKAVDTLNRQAGDYQQAEDRQQQVNVIIKEFVLTPPTPLQHPREKDITPLLFEQPSYIDSDNG